MNDQVLNTRLIAKGSEQRIGKEKEWSVVVVEEIRWIGRGGEG